MDGLWSGVTGLWSGVEWRGGDWIVSWTPWLLVSMDSKPGDPPSPQLQCEIDTASRYEIGVNTSGCVFEQPLRKRIPEQNTPSS